MPIVMGMIVYEKEHRLRVIMKMMGMFDRPCYRHYLRLNAQRLQLCGST